MIVNDIPGKVGQIIGHLPNILGFGFVTIGERIVAKTHRQPIFHPNNICLHDNRRRKVQHIPTYNIRKQFMNIKHTPFNNNNDHINQRVWQDKQT